MVTMPPRVDYFIVLILPDLIKHCDYQITATAIFPEITLFKESHPYLGRLQRLCSLSCAV